jgi:hypothetical protein
VWYYSSCAVPGYSPLAVCGQRTVMTSAAPKSMHIPVTQQTKKQLFFAWGCRPAAGSYNTCSYEVIEKAEKDIIVSQQPQFKQTPDPLDWVKLKLHVLLYNGLKTCVYDIYHNFFSLSQM